MGRFTNLAKFIDLGGVVSQNVNDPANIVGSPIAKKISMVMPRAGQGIYPDLILPDAVQQTYDIDRPCNPFFVHDPRAYMNHSLDQVQYLTPDNDPQFIALRHALKNKLFHALTIDVEVVYEGVNPDGSKKTINPVWLFKTLRHFADLVKDNIHLLKPASNTNPDFPVIFYYGNWYRDFDKNINEIVKDFYEHMAMYWVHKKQYIQLEHVPDPPENWSIPTMNSWFALQYAGDLYIDELKTKSGKSVRVDVNYANFLQEELWELLKWKPKDAPVIIPVPEPPEEPEETPTPEPPAVTEEQSLWWSIWSAIVKILKVFFK